MPDVEHFYQALGRGDINIRQLASALKIPELAPATFKLSPPKTVSQSAVTVEDLDNVVTTLAKCCSPVNGDEIIGFISHKRGITIHRSDCENILHLTPEQQTHLVKAEWTGGHKARHSVPIVIEALDGQNLLIDVSQLLSAAKVNITDAALKTHADHSATLTMQIQIENTAQLSSVLGRINQLPNVIEVTRKV